MSEISGAPVTETTATGPRRDSSAGSPPLLEVSGITKSFGHGRRRLTALDGVDVRLERGETLGLVGESGCGKSTLARVVLGLERPDAGTVRFDGTDPFTLKGKELLAWRRRVQMVFQDPFASLNARMSAADLIGEPWRTHRDIAPTAKDRERRVRELLSLVGLRDSDAHRYPNEFSGGQRQRIGIARALASDPELLVCDEATSALDVSVQAQVLRLLRDLQAERQLAYIVISHNLGVVREISSEVMVMRGGRVVESGLTETVLAGPAEPYTRALRRAALDPTTMRGRKPRALVSAIVSASDPEATSATAPEPATPS